MNRKIKVNGQWRDTLVRAAALYGEGFLAKDVATAFLKNMIAIETLLTHQGDRFPNAIIHRLVGLFGWVTGENIEPWEALVRRLYELRCSYVHDGHSGDVTGMDVYRAGELVRNLLDNLCRNTSRIQSKHDLIQLSEKCQAWRVLGMNVRRPKSMTYASRSLTAAGIAEINNVSNWSW